MTDVWARSQSCVVAGVPARVLSPPDSLLYVCGHASYSNSRESLRWVSDAWFIIDRHLNLDWDHFLDCVCLSRLALPLSVMVEYLAKDLGAPIPPSFLNRLHAAASQTDATGLEVALWGILAHRSGGVAKMIWSGRDWHTRAFVLKFLLLPSPGYLRWAEDLHHPWLLPFYYVYRPVRYITRCIGALPKNRMQPKVRASILRG
jgi:putative nucleotidyltransferase-like protein